VVSLRRFDLIRWQIPANLMPHSQSAQDAIPKRVSKPNDFFSPMMA
jgi:hypothetical protein